MTKMSIYLFSFYKLNVAHLEGKSIYEWLKWQ